MLIGLTGRAGAGKDTVYETIRDLHPDLAVERLSFADPLYASAAAALGVTPDQLREWKRDPDVGVCVVRCQPGGPLEVKSDITVRQYLQRYGTEAHREVFGDDFWVGAVNLYRHVGKVQVVTDVRFPNEAREVHDAGGVVVEVVGPGEGAPTHASEAALPGDLVDHVLPNITRDDNREALTRRVASLVTHLRFGVTR